MYNLANQYSKSFLFISIEDEVASFGTVINRNEHWAVEEVAGPLVYGNHYCHCNIPIKVFINTKLDGALKRKLDSEGELQ